MILTFLLLVVASSLVSSKSYGCYGDLESSSKMHTIYPYHDVSFDEIGRYDGQVNIWKYSKVYYISKYLISTWTEAKAICRSFDLELATFETLEELQSFLKLLESTDPFPKPSKDDLYADIAHIDGMTRNPGSSSDWYWTNSGVKIPYSLPWNPTQPDNGNGQIEACLTIQRFNGKFGLNDYYCSKLGTHFICQETQLFHNNN